MSILGNRVIRKEDPALLTGGGRFVDGLDIGDVVHVTFVRSTVAHAKLVSVDASEARAAPGVLAVYTADVLPLAPQPPPSFVVGAPPEMENPFLAGDVVRFVGEPVAMVVTEERYQGPDAAELVVIEYEELTPVVDPEQAVRDEVLLHPEAGTNIVTRIETERDEQLFNGCEVVIKGRFINQRIAPAPLETRAAASSWGADGRLTHWASTQTPHMLRGALARLLEVDEHQVHVITADVGGGFGAKSDLWREEGLVAWSARELGRTVKWMETRTESLTGWTHGRAQIHYVELGGSRDGRIEAYRLHVLQDCGAYVHFGPGMPGSTRPNSCRRRWEPRSRPARNWATSWFLWATSRRTRSPSCSPSSTACPRSTCATSRSTTRSST